MKPIWTEAVIAIAALASAATPTGPREPFRTRHVTMDGRSGPAYYSSASRTYRFIATCPNQDFAAVSR